MRDGAGNLDAIGRPRGQTRPRGRTGPSLAIALLVLVVNGDVVLAEGRSVVTGHHRRSVRVAAGHASPDATAATPKRVLILDSFGREVAPFRAAVTALRTTLARELGEPVHFYDESLDAARSAQPERERAFVTFLTSRFEGRPVDVVVPVGGPAVRFALQYRDRAFPGTPIVFAGVEPRLLPPDVLRDNATLVTQAIDLPSIVVGCGRRADVGPDARRRMG